MNTLSAKAPEAANLPPELAALLRRLEARGASRRERPGLRLLGISGLAALPLYFMGLLTTPQTVGLSLAGWLLFSREGLFRVRVQGAPRAILPRVLLSGLDLVLLLAVGYGCGAAEGTPLRGLLLGATAGLSSAWAAYSAVALLKAVPSKVRLAHPGAMVRLDHLFLSRVAFWGGEREIALGAAAAGLAAGFPLTGLVLAAVGSNLNWMVRAGLFWREVRDAKV
ncbi:hypothetical protein LLH00_11815 [bacterium]|nr:hypothetical protein [bacterium]